MPASWNHAPYSGCQCFGFGRMSLLLAACRGRQAITITVCTALSPCYACGVHDTVRSRHAKRYSEERQAMQPAETAHLVGLDEIAAARQVIAGTLHRTPTITSTALGERIGARLHFKAELFQKTGSFKPRGALNKLSSLSDEEKARGVITISAGNHAQALAYTAAQSGIAATVVMPATAVESQVDATRQTGAEVVLHGSHKDLLPKMQELQRERNLIYIPP